jgi:hypothetical protein
MTVKHKIIMSERIKSGQVTLPAKCNLSNNYLGIFFNTISIDKINLINNININ